jgi:hypothetical protein
VEDVAVEVRARRIEALQARRARIGVVGDRAGGDAVTQSRVAGVGVVVSERVEERVAGHSTSRGAALEWVAHGRFENGSAVALERQGALGERRHGRRQRRQCLILEELRSATTDGDEDQRQPHSGTHRRDIL